MEEKMGRYMLDKNKGFTIVEALCVSVILLFVLTAVFSTYTLLTRYVRDTTTQTDSQSETRIAVDRIARDIRLATAVTCPASGINIDLTYDPGRIGQAGSVWTSRYRLSGSQILYRPDISLGGETVVLEDLDIDLVGGETPFQYDDIRRLVTINLNVENASMTTTQDTRLITTVKVKNVP